MLFCLLSFLQMSFSLAKQVTVDGEPSALVHVVHGVDYDDYGKAILEMSDIFANYSLPYQ